MKRTSRSSEAARPVGASDSSSLRGAVIRALEALEAGNQWEATDILLAALEDVDVPRRIACPRCDVRFCWPGELDHHLRFSHRSEAAA
jgi:hypothetical protein